jgi:hypothetical protein
LSDGLFDRFVHEGLVDVVPSLLAGTWVHPAILLWERELPTPLAVGVGIPTGQRVPKTVVVQEAIDARQLMGVGDMSAIKRQKVLYPHDGAQLTGPPASNVEFRTSASRGE